MAGEPKTVAELAEGIKKSALANQLARQDDECRDALKAVARDNRAMRRELNSEDRTERAAESVADALAKADYIAGLSPEQQDKLGQETVLSQRVQAKLDKEKEAHKGTKAELNKAQSTIKKLEATTKALEAQVTKLTAQVNKAAKKGAKKGAKAQATTVAPEAAPNS